MKIYALNIGDNYRVKSATFDEYAPVDWPRVNENKMPEGDIADYKYKDGVFAYSPLPQPEKEIRYTQNQADTTYISMMAEIDLENINDKYSLLNDFYKQNLWNENKIQNAVGKNWITEEQAEEILYANKKD